ncbi:MAG: LamG domain-containing protein, partial [bacterium]|nr:LamG domain-containing protein [bacterium]
MGIILKLEKGARSLDLTTGRYRVRPDFKPPATAVTAFYASGTNRNRHGGGNRVGNKANNTQWGFTVDCKGDTEAEVNRAVGNLTAFLKMAGDEIEPLYLAFRGNTDIASEPTWGQYGANMRFEIVNSQTPQIDPVYGKGRVRQAMARVSLSLTIKPYAYGVRQKLAKGLGGIAEYKVGSFDGRSRGIAVPVAITNRVTNPVFGTRSAIVNWGSGWNTGADLIMERCVDPEYTIEAYGGASVRLTMHADTGDALFDQALVNNAGHFSFYAKMLNGEEITASHIAIAVTSGSSITTNIEGVGDGWHYVWGEVAAFSPPGPTAVMGVELQAIGTVVHVTGFQLEDGGYAPTPLAYGDLLGCDWSSTAHLSTTTRDVAELNLDVTGFYSSNIYSDGQGTIRMAVEATSNSTDVPAAEHFFFTTDQTTGNLELRYYGSGANTLGLYGKGGAAVSDTLAFSHGDIIVIHAVWGSGGMHLYVNGVAHGTSDTYDPGSALTETLHIGHDGTVSGKQCGHIIKDFTIWTEPATAAEVLADYTNLLPILTDGEVLSPLPYAWDKDGDGIVDNAYDSTRSNHMIASGIAGDAPARTTMVIQKDSGEDDESIWFSNFVTSRFVDPSIYKKEFQGTVDANASEGEYEAITVGTTVVNETITNSW